MGARAINDGIDQDNGGEHAGGRGRRRCDVDVRRIVELRGRNKLRMEE